MNNTIMKRTNVNVTFTRTKPVEWHWRGEVSCFIDFGNDAFGTLELRIEAKQRHCLEICLGEVLDADGQLVEPEAGQPECSRRFRRIGLWVMPDKQVYRLTLPEPYLLDHYQPRGYNCSAGVPCAEVTGEIMPFRYCEIKGCRDDLTIHSVDRLMAHVPFDDNAATFTSSDENLNRVWEFCKHTIKATTCFGIYVDGDRERLPYAGDALVNQYSHFCLDRYYEIARDTIEWFCQKGTSWCYEFPMIIPQLAWHYYLYSGDDGLLKEHYSLLKDMTLKGLRRDDGLIETGRDLIEHPLVDRLRPRDGFFRDVIDWPVNMRDGYELGQINTVANSFHGTSLDAISNIAAAIGYHDEAHSFRKDWLGLKENLQKVLFKRQSGLFVDSALSTHSSLHACMHPVAHGLVEGLELSTLKNFIKSKGMACSVWGAFFLLKALCELGETEQALQLMTAEDERSWLGMMTQGATMTMEAWSDELKPQQDWNHPWATSPVYIISSHIMGVKPQAAGYRKVAINPQPGGLDYARITVPTIHGQIMVEVEQDDKEYRIKTEIPDGIERV